MVGSTGVDGVVDRPVGVDPLALLPPIAAAEEEVEVDGEVA